MRLLSWMLVGSMLQLQAVAQSDELRLWISRMACASATNTPDVSARNTPDVSVRNTPDVSVRNTSDDLVINMSDILVPDVSATNVPYALRQLRMQYAADIRAALAPLKAKYQAKLDALMRQLGAAGKIEDAAIVKKELDALVANGSSAQSADASRPVGKSDSKLKIISAKYGVDTRWTDATQYVRDRGSGWVLSANTIEAAVGDPARRAPKDLVVVYEYGGARRQKVFQYGQTVTLE